MKIGHAVTGVDRLFDTGQEMQPIRGMRCDL